MLESLNLTLARAQGRRADDWAAYARELEAQLREAEANLRGVRAVRDAALAELSKVDPKNYMLVQANRQAIGQAAYEEELRRRRAS